MNTSINSRGGRVALDRVRGIDRDNTKLMLTVLAKCGWPKRSEVGEKARGLFLVLGRALLALVVSVGFLALGAAGAMHSPPPWAAYLAWLLFLVLSTFILGAWSAIGGARRRPGA